MNAAGRTLTVGELREETRRATRGRVVVGSDVLPLYVADGETEHAVAGVEARSGGGWSLRVEGLLRVDEDVAEFLRELAGGNYSLRNARDEAGVLVRALGLA